MNRLLIIIIALIILIILSISSFFIYRWINYNLAYRSMVEQTIKEMVKTEALK